VAAKATPPALARGPSPGTGRMSEIQRGRLLAATAVAACEEGAANLTVANVVERARVSRRTFYELFDGVQDCVLALFDDAAARAQSVVLEPWESDGVDWRGRVRASLAALLILFDSEPQLARLLVVEWPTVGAPATLRRRFRICARLAHALDEGREDGSGTQSDPPALIAEGVVGALASILHARLVQTDGGPLLDLLNPLMSMIVLPYLGAVAARRELSQPVPAVPAPDPGAQAGNSVERLGVRITHRTVSVLRAVAQRPGASNRLIAQHAGISDQGQISKLLRRLQRAGLVENTGGASGAPNAWTLTAKGQRLERYLRP
jgi:AcrR family transcriptional regulator